MNRIASTSSENVTVSSIWQYHTESGNIRTEINREPLVHVIFDTFQIDMRERRIGNIH